MTDYKLVLKHAFWLVALIFACRLTHAFVAPVLVFFAIVATFAQRNALPIWTCLALPFVVCTSAYIITDRTPLVLSARIGYILIGITLIVLNLKCMKNKSVPLGLLFVYCVFEVFPSAFGYSPRVSYYKLLFFSLYILSLCAFAKSIVANVTLLKGARHMLLAICVVLLIGSLCTLPFPAVAYPLTTRWLLHEGMDLATASQEIAATMGTRGMMLFAGLTLHSQMLGPMLTMVICYLLCDMLFVEHRTTKFHALLLIISFVFAYMTRSRTALFSLIVAITMIGVFTSRRIQLSARVKRSVHGALALFACVVVIGAIAAEIRSGALTKWLFKGEVGSSSTVNAITSTRLGAIEELTRDFKRNPLIGCGFQVNEDSARYNSETFVFSAPVEKGLLPLVIIGEGGVLGAMIFILFLIVFYCSCVKMRLYCTLTSFTTMLATNIGEATFFAPGGVGGFLWCFAIIGGGVLDALQKRDSRGMVQIYRTLPYGYSN